MEKENKMSDCCNKNHRFKRHRPYYSGGSNAIYGLGVIGALFYFLQNATNATMVLVGVGKAIFWPAILMFKILADLKM
jgi:hypothetical protein